MKPTTAFLLLALAVSVLVAVLLGLGSCRRPVPAETAALAADTPPPLARARLPAPLLTTPRQREPRAKPAKTKAVPVRETPPRFTCAQAREAAANYPKFMLESLAILNKVTAEERAFGERCLRRAR